MCLRSRLCAGVHTHILDKPLDTSVAAVPHGNERYHMARTVQDAKLGTRTARAELAPSGKPYYRTIEEGLHLGYRKGKHSGKWVVRIYDKSEGGYKVETIGTADDTGDPNGTDILNFAQAQKLARQKYDERQRAAKVAAEPAPKPPYTVRDAIKEYLAFLETNRKTARDARWRAEALILPELGNAACADLTKDLLKRWLDAAAQSAPRLRTRAGETHKYRDIGKGDGARRRKATANRVLTIIKAALNRAWRDGKIADDRAWRQLEPFEGADQPRVRYLTVAECQRLINASQGEFRTLVRAALATGCRYGELGALEVRDFNQDVGTLHVAASKAGKDRHVVLEEEGIDLFKALAVGRLGSEPMLRKPDGTRWLKSHQDRPMREACNKAKIDPPVSFHVLRHCWASLSVMNGAALMVIAKNLGHSDTRMVEKHYGHLAPSYVADEIRRAAPRFGIAASNVAPLRGAR
jgi:integrase